MTYIDPVTASPRNYKVLHEDDGVRLLEMRLPPGTSDVEHSHPSELVYFLKGSKVRVHVPGAAPIELDPPDGFVLPHEPWTHRVENIGQKELLAIIFEKKG